MKTCSRCKEAKEPSLFGLDKSRPDGRSYWCKACLAQKNHAWDSANKDRKAATRRARYEANREKVLEESRARYASNKERHARSVKKWREENRQRAADIRRKWESRNREKVCAKTALRKASKLRATPAWCDLSAIQDFFDAAAAFRMYTGQEYHVDHIVPLRGKTVCGLHVPNNLQVLPATENARKGNRYWPDMP